MTRTIPILISTLLVTGCATVVSDNGICDATARAVTEHAAALALDGGPQSLRTGDRLVRMLDAGCAG